MGSAASKTASKASKAASRLGKKDVNRITVSLPVSYGAESTKPRDTLGFDISRRLGPDEWGKTLNRMSAVINSAAWTETPTMAGNGDEVRSKNLEIRGSPKNSHAARRSAAMRNKLPSKWRGNEEAEDHVSSQEPITGGKLSQENFLLLFRLHRQDSGRWNAQELSERFHVSPIDIQNLLAYSRTYLGRLDRDGIVRGYYDPDRRNTIRRFERE